MNMEFGGIHTPNPFLTEKQNKLIADAQSEGRKQLADGVTMGSDVIGLSAFGRGAMRSGVVTLPRLIYAIGRNGLSGVDDMELTDYERDKYSTDSRGRRMLLQKLPESVRNVAESALDYRDKYWSVVGQLLPDVAAFRYIPGVSTIKAPLKAAITAYKTRPGIMPVVKQTLKKTPGWFFFKASPDIHIATEIYKDLTGQETSSVQSGRERATETANREAAIVRSHNRIKTIQNDPNLSQAEKVQRIQLEQKRIEAVAKTPDGAAVPVVKEPKKPKTFLDYLNEYKGEIGFGALGGATGYGIGHLMKWKMPLKLLSAITGAAMGAYGYHKYKG